MISHFLLINNIPQTSSNICSGLACPLVHQPGLHSLRSKRSFSDRVGVATRFWVLFCLCPDFLILSNNILLFGVTLLAGVPIHLQDKSSNPYIKVVSGLKRVSAAVMLLLIASFHLKVMHGISPIFIV